MPKAGKTRTPSRRTRRRARPRTARPAKRAPAGRALAAVAGAGLQFDRDVFLQAYEDRFGSPTDRQATALDLLLEQVWRDAGFSVLRHVAYMLATIKWETGQSFEPLKEKRARQGISAAQDKVFAAQEKYWGTGFYGRGYVQITFEDNYRKAGTRLAGLAIDVPANGATSPVTITPTSFVDDPDLVLQPAVAYLIASRGMREGWFRSRKGGPPYRLDDFIHEEGPTDYLHARDIINGGLDRADVIAGYADRLELILRASRQG